MGERQEENREGGWKPWGEVVMVDASMGTRGERECSYI